MGKNKRILGFNSVGLPIFKPTKPVKPPKDLVVIKVNDILEPPQKQEVKTCKRKRPFGALDAALTVAAKYKQNVYICPVCKKWHLSKL